MKILQVIPGAQEGNSFVFAKREYRILSSLYPHDVEVYYFNTKLSPRNLIRGFQDIRRIIKKSKVSVVHSQYGTITGFISLLAIKGQKLVVTFRGSDINGSSDVSFLRRCVSKFLSWVTLRYADHVIFVSEGLKRNAPRIQSEISVIRSGVDTDLFKPMEREKSVGELGLDTNKKYAFFYSSFNSKNKRKDLAVGALEVLKKSGANIELLEVEGNVPSDKMPFYINAADVVLMLSDREGSPTVVQEAIACGTPVVSVEVGDVRETIKDISNSFIVGRDPDLIARGILAALSAGKSSPKQQLIEDLSLKSCVNRIYSIYKSLM